MLHHPNIDPVLVALGQLKVHWYGVMYLCAFGFAFWICRLRARQNRAPFKESQVDDLIFYVAMGTILGGRVGYMLFYNFQQLLTDPISLIAIWKGGMSFHGGLLGVIAALALFARKKGIKTGDMMDIAALAAPIGLFFGRIGNFIGQELWGRPTDVPWAMLFPNDPSLLPRHPSQLYEAILEGLVIFIVIYCYLNRTRPRWAAGALFLILYGSFRFFVEFFREPDAHIGIDLLGWMSRGQILSIPMILIGACVLFWAYHKNAQSGNLAAPQQKVKC